MSRINLPKIYNPAQQPASELIDNFVVRTEIFNEIFQDIKNSEMQYPEQHYIIQGSRGQGKTTLLLRISYEIDRDSELRQRLIPIVFNEEQYNITKLYKLWETVAEYIDESGDIKDQIRKQMEDLDFDDNVYEQSCFELIEQTLIKNKKKIILFIDNIDEMFEKFSKKDHHRLREIFTESAEFRIIGASSVSLEFHHDYSKPFYQFFKMPQLNGLNADETRQLLLGLGKHYKKEKVDQIVSQQPGRIESLRRLTGGVIRTIIILFEIFVDDENGNALKDLEVVLDSVTPLYKSRMDGLTPQQQEIVDVIALNWDAVSTREISRKTKLESKAVSAQLGQLIKHNIVEKEKTNTKNFLYRIHERFFNIWYLMRLGRKWDEKRVRFVVEFLQLWCDNKELEKRANRHIKALHGKEKNFDKAKEYYQMAADNGHAGAMNNLALMYFRNKTKKKEALELARHSYKKEDKKSVSHTYAMLLLWNNQIAEAIKMADNFLNDKEFIEEEKENITLFLLLLIAKQQFHLAYKIFHENPHKLVDRFRPVYYALMNYMKNNYPNEYLKMGGELKETVDEIIQRIEQLKIAYR